MSQAAIVDLEVSAVLIPIKPPHRVAGGLLESSPLLLIDLHFDCLLYTSPSPRDLSTSRMPSSA